MKLWKTKRPTTALLAYPLTAAVLYGGMFLVRPEGLAQTQLGVPLPEMVITGPGPDTTTQYFNAEGDLIGQAETTFQRKPYPHLLREPYREPVLVPCCYPNGRLK